MKKKYYWLQLIAGFVLFLVGILTYGLGKLNIITIQSGGIGVWGIVIVGILLIVSATCGDFFKKTKEQEIEEKDERNIAIAHRAKAAAFDAMLFLFAVVFIVLIHRGNLDLFSFLLMFGAYGVILIVFAISLRHFQKKM